MGGVGWRYSRGSGVEVASCTVSIFPLLMKVAMEIGLDVKLRWRWEGGAEHVHTYVLHTDVQLALNFSVLPSPICPVCWMQFQSIIYSLNKC